MAHLIFKIVFQPGLTDLQRLASSAQVNVMRTALRFGRCALSSRRRAVVARTPCGAALRFRSRES
jgi:hypothetical protein